MILVPLFDLKFLNELAAGGEELQIGGTSRSLRMLAGDWSGLRAAIEYQDKGCPMLRRRTPSYMSVYRSSERRRRAGDATMRTISRRFAAIAVLYWLGMSSTLGVAHAEPLRDIKPLADWVARDGIAGTLPGPVAEQLGLGAAPLAVMQKGLQRPDSDVFFLQVTELDGEQRLFAIWRQEKKSVVTIWLVSPRGEVLRTLDVSNVVNVIVPNHVYEARLQKVIAAFKELMARPPAPDAER